MLGKLPITNKLLSNVRFPHLTNDAVIKGIVLSGITISLGYNFIGALDVIS